jgi:hypothetical protein
MVDSEHYIDDHIRRTRRALKLVDFSSGVITLLAALLLFLLGAAVIDHWVVPGGLGTLGRGATFAALVALIAWIAWRQFLPLLRSINPVYAAHTIEQTTPSLKNSLLNVLLFRTHRRNMSAKVYYALEQQAAQRLSTAPADATVDHTALLRLGYALMLAVALCAAYAALSPKNPIVSAARVLAPWSDLAAPSRVKILGIEPGDTQLARGERLTVSAEIHGAREGEPVRLRFSTNDQQLVDESIPMTRPAEGVRFEAQLPRSADAAATSGVQQDLEYWIEAGDAHTRRYKVNVYNRPTMVVERVRYEFPAYTGLPSAEQASSGDISGVEGTRVAIQGIANQPIKNAWIDFDADGKNDVKMFVDSATGDRATASFTLALRPDRRTPAHPSYVLRLVTTADRANVDPAQYRIEVTPDYAPEVRITRPEEPEVEVRVDEIVPIGVEARDPDFAVQQVRLMGKTGDRELELGELLSKNHAGRFTGMKPVVPADAQLKPGDVLEFWAEARDNRRPEANVAYSDHRRLRIIGGEEKADREQRNQQQPGGEPASAGGGQPNDANQPGQQGGAQAGGQGQEGEQSDGEGEAASAAGGGRAGDQNQQPQDGEGEQSPGGGGQPNQEPSSDGNAAGNQQNNAGDASAAQNQGDPNNPNGDQQQQAGGDQQKSGGQSQGAQGGKPAGARQEKVSPEGDADADAFERMSDHFAEQDAKNGAGQQSAQQPGGERAQPNDQQQNDQQQNGQQQDGEAASAAGQQGENASQSKNQSGAQSPNAKPQQGAQPQAGQQAGDGQAPAGERQQGEQTEQQQGNANAGQPPADERRAPGEQLGDKSAGQPNGNQEQPTPQGGMNRNQGDAGAGQSSDEQQGAPHMDEQQDPHKRARDKQPGANEKAAGDKQPASGAGDKQESDSKGSQSGDRSGGGQEGKGQHADAPGKGESGQHEAADQGAGKSNQQGEGETGDQGGQQQTADGQTGQSSGDQPGAGQRVAESLRDSKSPAPNDGANQQPGEPASAGGQPGQDAPQSGQQPGAKQPGEAASAGGERDDTVPKPDQKPGEESPNEKPESQPGANQKPGEKPAAQQPPAHRNADPSQQQQNQSPDQGAQPGGASGQLPQGGGPRTGTFDGPAQPDAPDKEDAANLEFARQQTDLVLERLDDQLANQKVDKNLLDNLGWNEDELRRFVSRWQGLKNRAQSDESARQELDEALRSLGPIGGAKQFRAQAAKDKFRDLNEGYRSRAPLEYADRVRAYVKGAASDSEN